MMDAVGLGEEEEGDQEVSPWGDCQLESIDDRTARDLARGKAEGGPFTIFWGRGFGRTVHQPGCLNENKKLEYPALSYAPSAN